MNEMSRTWCFLFVLLACFLQYSAENYLLEHNNLNRSDVGDVFNIEQNGNENVADESISLKSGNQIRLFDEYNETNFMEQNDSAYRSKDMPAIEVEKGKILKETATLWFNRKEQDVGLKESQSEKSWNKTKKIDKTIGKSWSGVQETANKNQNVKEIESLNNWMKIFGTKSSKLKNKYLNVLKTEFNKNAIRFRENNNLLSSLEHYKKIITALRKSTGKHSKKFDENFIKMFYNANLSSIHRLDNWLNVVMNNVKDYPHDVGILLEIRPRLISVVMNSTGNGNGGTWTNSLNNASFNHRISRRRPPPPSLRFDSGCSEEDSLEAFQKLGKCHIPKNLENSAIKCIVYEFKIKCLQTCAYGAKLENGKEKRRLLCYKKKGKWGHNSSIFDCKSHLQCDMMLKYGKSKCFSHYMYKKPRCLIDCGHGTGSKIHTCDIHDNWKPRLPKCARKERV